MLDELQELFDKVAQLPEDEQAFYAAILREELESEAKWDALFEKSPEKLEKLVEQWREEAKEGDIIELRPDNIDDVLG